MKRKYLDKKRRKDAKRRLAAGPTSVGDANVTAGAHLQRKMRIPVYFSDLMDRVPSEDEIDALVSSFVRTPSFLMLAMLNTFLAFYEQDDKQAFTYVQGFLFKNLTDDELFERARQRFPHEEMGSRPMFHRQQMMVLLKKVLLLADETGKYNPNVPENKEAKCALGKLALMTNDLLNSDEQAQKLNEQEERRKRYEELVTQILPVYEFSDPPEVIPALVRNDEYFHIFERMAGQKKLVFSDGESVPARFLKLTGLKLKDYLLMILSVYLNYKGVSTQEGAVKLLIENPAKFNIGVDELFRKMRFTVEQTKAFFGQTSTSIERLIDACRDVKSKSPLLQQYDFTAFRMHPLVYTREQQDFVTLIDFSFLAEKISTGVYHSIKLPLEDAFKSLDQTRDRDVAKIAKKDHEQFLGYWGNAFEIYVNERLAEIPYRRLKRFYASPHYDEPPSRSDREAFDAVLDYGRDLVVFEHKGKYLDLAAKYSGDRELLLAELKSDKRIGKALYQFADNLEFVFDSGEDAKRHTFHERDARGNVSKRFDLKDICRVKGIYPVVIHQDFSLRLNGINQIMGEFFREEISKRRVEQRSVRPFCMLSIEDLEIAIPYLVDVPLPDILDAYARNDDPLTTFEIIFKKFLRKQHIKPRRNQWIDKRSDEIQQQIHDLFVDLSD
jgi:hypothetical protein